MTLQAIYSTDYARTEAQGCASCAAGDDPGVDVFEGDTVDSIWAFGPSIGNDVGIVNVPVYWPSATILQYDNSVATPTLDHIVLPYKSRYEVKFASLWHVGALATTTTWDGGNITAHIRLNGIILFTTVFTPGAGSAFGQIWSVSAGYRQFDGDVGDTVTLEFEDNIGVVYSGGSSGDTRTPGLIYDGSALTVVRYAETGGGSGLSGAIIAQPMRAQVMEYPSLPQGNNFIAELMTANALMYAATTIPATVTVQVSGWIAG
jgi:hypothetical protein